MSVLDKILQFQTQQRFQGLIWYPVCKSKLQPASVRKIYMYICVFKQIYHNQLSSLQPRKLFSGHEKNYLFYFQWFNILSVDKLALLLSLGYENALNMELLEVFLSINVGQGQPVLLLSRCHSQFCKLNDCVFQTF